MPVISAVSSACLNEQLHEADRAEVVDLVRLHLLDDGDQRRQVAQVTLDDLERRVLGLDQIRLRVVLPSYEAEHLVALRGQELREVASVLSGDPGDQCALHVSPSGASWYKNSAQRAASSVSPIASADVRNPSRARRKPRFVSCFQRT